jgi:hypothetical protein
MLGSPKEWASLLGFDRDTDEKAVAARARVLARTLGYLEDHFSDPDGERPQEAVVLEFGQFLAMAEGMESKGRGSKFKELYEAIIDLHARWDVLDRDAAVQALAKKAALFKGILAFCDAWLGSETPIPRRRPAAVPEPVFDEADIKTRIVRPAHLRP